ncbi:MAG: type II toxin-antitoxin system RelE/ParE family toxin [Bacteroides sp.]|nr:type II toxin-antitoxin system RelE/ParE family toxin [Bacteroides sp.]
MGALNIIIRKDALSFMEKVTQWYEYKMGPKAARHFVDGIWDTINTLSYSPNIGTLDEKRSTAKTKYYSFLSHPKYRIIYRFTKTNLYIAAIHATLMNRN